MINSEERVLTGVIVTDLVGKLEPGKVFSPPKILTTAESGEGIVARVVEATRESTSGRFVDYSGKLLEW
jgi:hypothetical protein